MDRPLYAVWEITLRCDLHCAHCGSRAGKARPGELTTAEALDLIAQLAALGVTEVTLIGGEAYLRDDWTTLLAAIRDAGMLPTLTTGGRRLDAARAQAAARAGLVNASVSIDGVAATHDRLRGVAGSHAAALAALGHLRAAGVQIAANTQVNAANLDELPQILDQLALARVRAWQVQLTVAMGRAADRPELVIQPHDMLRLVPLVARLATDARARGIELFPGNNLGTIGPLDRALRRHGSGACGAGRATLGIEADGAIKGCPSLPTASYTGGNIRTHTLREIWEQTAPLRFARERTVDDLWGFCRTCEHAARCLAGCNWTAHCTLGVPGNNPFCHHRALTLAKRDQREVLVPRTAPAGTPFDHGELELVVEAWPLAARQAWFEERA